VRRGRERERQRERRVGKRQGEGREIWVEQTARGLGFRFQGFGFWVQGPGSRV